MRKKIIQRWHAETPIFARLMQFVCGALVFVPHFYTALPEEFKVFTPIELKGIAIAAIIAGLLLNLTKKKEQ